MKTTLKILSIFALVCFLGGCKKTYICECIQVSVPEGNMSEFKVKARKRNEAETECSKRTTYTTNTVPQTVDTQCSLR